jgi:hypothetical protein
MSINNFLATVRSRGFAKSSRYMVVIDLPRGPSANNLGQTGAWGDGKFGNQFSGYTAMKEGQYLTSLYCEATSLPAKNIDTKLNKQYGPGREIPYGHSYTPINLTFYIDRDYIIKRFFEHWQNMIVNEDSGHTNYYNEYTTQVHILALDAKDGESLSGSLSARYQCTLIEAYPKTIAEVAYGAGNADVARLQVSMQYRKWTETTAATGIGSLQSTVPQFANLIYNPATGILTGSPAGGDLDG